MKKILFIIAIILFSLPYVIFARATQPLLSGSISIPSPSPILGDGNINTLDQFTSTTSPASAITQRTFGKTFRLTGLTGCLEASSNGTVSSVTGAPCGSGGGGGADGNWVYFNGSGIRLATTSNQVVIGAVSTTTTAKVEVAGNINVRTNYITGTSYNQMLAVLNNDSNWGFGGYNSGSTYWVKASYADIGDGLRGFSVIDQAFPTLPVFHSNQTRTYVRNGKFGVGTTTPWRTLSVTGDSDLGNNAMAGYFTATTSTASSFPYASTTAISSVTSSTSKAIIGTGSLSAPSLAISGDEDTGIYSHTANGIAVTTGGTQKLTIGSTGTISAVNSSLLEDLTTGAYTLSGALGTISLPTYSFTGDTNTGLWSQTADTLNLSVGGVETFKTDATSSIFPIGNVGVGTTTPYAKLSVAGQVVGSHFTATTSTASTFPYASSTALTVSGALYNTSLSDGCLNSTSGKIGSTGSACGSGGGGGSGIGWASTTVPNTNSIYSTQLSNVGIGTTSPYAKLSVVGPVVAESFNATSTTATSTVRNALGVTNYLYVGPYLYDGLYPLYTGNFSPTNFVADFTKDVDNYAAINFSNPNAGVNASVDLTFNNDKTGDANDDLEYEYYGDIGFTSSTYNVPYYGIQNVPNMLYMYNKDGPVSILSATSSATAGYINFGVGGFSGTESMRITNTGAVGIGSTSPSARLTVTNPLSTKTLVIEDSTSDATPTVIDETGQFIIGGATTTDNYFNIYRAPFPFVNRSDASYSVGYSFNVRATTTINRLGRYWQSANDENHRVRLWDASATTFPIGDVIVAHSSTADAYGFKWTATTSIQLVPSKTYVMGVDETTTDIWADQWAVTPNIIDNNFNIIQSRYVSGSGYPATGVTSSNIYSSGAMAYTPTTKLAVVGTTTGTVFIATGREPNYFQNASTTNLSAYTATSTYYRAGNGTSALPAITGADTDTGLYFNTANTTSVSAGGVNILDFLTDTDSTIASKNGSAIKMTANGGQNVFRGLDNWTGTYTDSAITTYFQTGRTSGNTAFSSASGQAYGRSSFITNAFQVTNMTASVPVPRNFFEVIYSSSNLFNIASSTGNVGVATSTPAVKLDVYGQIRATNPTKPTCDATIRGSIQYDVSDDHFYGCRVSGWAQLDN